MLIDYIDKTIARLMIWRLKDGYGDKCSVYIKECEKCQANKVIDWLRDFIKLCDY